ncbi:MAG: alpha-amylase family glycosyl hydrolase [Acidobacteriota bacterium]
MLKLPRRFVAGTRPAASHTPSDGASSNRCPAAVRLGVGCLFLALLSACASVPTDRAAENAGASAASPAAATEQAATEQAATEQAATKQTDDPPAIVRTTAHSSWAEAVLYFVIVDRFADGDPSNNDVDTDPAKKGHFHGGDLAGLEQRLDDLAELGVTALWITPLVDNIDSYVSGAGFPDYAYHGYWADDFNSLDPRFGTEAELKSLVDAAHERGIAVLLDVVYNHVGYEAAWTRDPRYRPWLRSSQPGGCGQDDLTQCLAGLPDLRTELPEVREYLFDAHLGLAERVGLDGFRLDTVKHISHDFWQEHRRAVDERLGEEFFLLGEVWGGDARVLDPYFEPDELDAGFDFGFQGSTLAFVQGRGRPVAFGRYLEKRHETRDGYHLAHYLSSHDVPTSLYQLDGDIARHQLATFLKLTTVGIPTLMYGDEVARFGGDWPENRAPMPWGELGIEPGAGLERDDALRDFVRRTIAARRAHPALWRGTHETMGHGADHLVFRRADPQSDDVVWVAVNRSEEPLEVSLEIPVGLVDVMTGERFESRDEVVAVVLEPLSGRILSERVLSGRVVQSEP